MQKLRKGVELCWTYACISFVHRTVLNMLAEALKMSEIWLEKHPLEVQNHVFEASGEPLCPR